MAKGYLMVDLDDPRAGHVAEAMANGACKRILKALSETELSESELAARLGMPAPTVHYNIKKLMQAGLVTTRSSLWSMKGRQVKRYTLAHKRIVISPRSLKRGIIPAFIASIGIAAVLKWFSQAQSREVEQMALKVVSDAAGSSAGISVATDAMNTSSSYATAMPAAESVNSVAQTSHGVFYTFLASAPNSWAWFLIGSLSALVIYMLWSWMRE